MKHSRCAALPKLLQQILRLIGNAASLRQAPNDLPFVVRDREFVE